MAQVKVKYKCGHEGWLNNKDWKVKYLDYCPECYERIAFQRREEKRKKEIEKIKKAKKGLFLPELTGSEKQIKWAISLRDKLILKLKHEEELGWLSELEKFIENFRFFLETETNSECFIKNFQYVDNSNLYSFLKNYIPITEEEKEIEREAKKESIIIPENWNNKSNYEVIQISENTIKVIGEKDDLVRKYLKNKGFKWKGDGWYKILFKEDNINDRVCEIANRLLQIGWSVYALESLKEKIISANFKKELFIIKYDDKNVKIFWYGKNDALYKVTRNLPYSKWDGGVIVNIAYYKEIYDFAEIYDFNISDEAKIILDNFEKVIKNPIKICNSNNKADEKLNAILSSDTILEDLKDE